MSKVLEMRRGDNRGSQWESLCPELFALILKAVQQNAGRDAGEVRRVVALAGVCRRWRQLIQQSYSSPLSEIGLLQFPFALRQPGPSNRPMQCLLKKHRSGVFVLFQQNLTHDGSKQKLDFLMAARRKWQACGSCFAISASHTSFSKSGHAYMGKLRSDIWGAEFNLWETMGHQPKNKRLALRISYSDCSREGLRGRAMACELYTRVKRPASTRWSDEYPEIHGQASTCSGVGTKQTAIVIRYNFTYSFLSCFPLSPMQERAPPPKQKPAATFLRSYSSLRRANYSFSERSNSMRGSRELGEQSNAFFMESKAPHWDEQSQCWSLDFHGRASLPSQYNFQLIQSPMSSSGGSPSDSIVSDSQAINDTIFLQLGKVGKGLYTVDFCHPLSAFQAFSICLSSFATKVGVEP